jgi:ribose transport system substrate-binding protein
MYSFINRRVTSMANVAAGALLCAVAATAPAADSALLQKALGTTEGIGAIVMESFDRASKPLPAADRELALKCWKDNVCNTGRGDVTVALADGFGENVWRQVTHMEFVMQALTYPNVRKIIYTSAQGDATKAVADMRSLIAQKVNVIATFPDAGSALLPTVKEATEQGIVVVPYIAGLSGNAGKDYLTFVAEDLCELGKQFVQYVSQNAKGNSIGIVELGGTPGNQLSSSWQKCSEEEIKKNNKMKLLGKADTNWTQEGTFQAMSGFLSQNSNINAVLYEYADGFRGGVRAYQSANKPTDVVVALRTDEQGLFCDWEKANNPNFKIFFSSGGTFQSRIALTAAMLKVKGTAVPERVEVPFKMKQVKAGMCDSSMPDQMPVSSAVDGQMLTKMFKK